MSTHSHSLSPRRRRNNLQAWCSLCPAHPSAPAPLSVHRCPPHSHSYMPQPSPGPSAWYGVWNHWKCIPAPGANTNTSRHRSFRPPSVAVLVPHVLVDAAPSVDLVRFTTASDSNSTPQVFYTTQEIDAHFLKDLELTTPPKPTKPAP